MKYNYTFIRIFIFIIMIYIFYPIINKYLNLLLGINKSLIGSNLIEGFVWSRDTTKKFNEYQDTVNLNQNRFNMKVLQEQASEDEVKELLKTGYWPWSEDTKKQYMEAVWQNSIIKIDPNAALDYAMKLYNETAAKRLLSWNTKEGEFLLYGSTNDSNKNIIGISTGDDLLANGEGQGITVDGQISKKNIYKCSDDPIPVLQKTTINGYNLSNGFKNTTTVDLALEDIPNEIAGFSFVNGYCNPCAPLNNKPDYSCAFKLNVEGNDEISDVWKNLWQINSI
jgi:hypothetical protein